MEYVLIVGFAFGGALAFFMLREIWNEAIEKRALDIAKDYIARMRRPD
jgi:hypothetical protein